MLRVGLTGGIASGKSTVGEMLATLGAAWLDADEVVAGLYEAGQPGALAVAELFGEAVLAPDGSVDRAALAQQALGNPTARRALHARIHPLVREEIRSWFASLACSDTPPQVAVVEAALLVETGAYRDFDVLVVVTAPLEVRRQRALAAGFSPAQFDMTLQAQASDEERRRLADAVVTNDGGLRALAEQVAALWEFLLARAASSAGR